MAATIRLGNAEIRPAERRLWVDGRPAPLGSRAFDVLMALIERSDRVVAKKELLEVVWPDLVVEENNLQVQISTLRKLLGPQSIATVPGRGYQLTVGVRSGAQTAAPAVSDSASPAPAAAPALFGRAEDLRAVIDLLVAHPLVTITGAGGIGKTRLAQAVHQSLHANFADGAFFVEFAALSDPALVTGALAQASGLSVEPGRSPLQALLSLLRTQQMLLVLDNCEHLIDAVAHCVSTLLRDARGLRILATSQEPLKTENEVLYRLGTLMIGSADGDAAGGAVELFVARVRSADARVRFDAAALAIAAEICRRLDGIPLAIELAAARVPLLGLEGVRARLDERFNILTGGARTVMRRHQTLRAALEWSHGLLSADEQVVFRRLGVFAGSFGLELAQSVVADEARDRWAVLDLLGHLVDKSLVLVQGAAEPRYQLLETTRAYALEQLAAAGETREWLHRHATALSSYLAELDEKGWSLSSNQTARLAAEIDNLRSALDWTSTHDRPLACALIARSGRVWQANAQRLEGAQRCRNLQPLPPELTALDRAHFNLTIAKVGAATHSAECFQAACSAEQMFAALGADLHRLDALRLIVYVGSKRGDDVPVAEALAQARRLIRADTPHRLVAGLDAAESLWHVMKGRDREAFECSERQLALYRKNGDKSGVWLAEANAAFNALSLGDLEAAIARLDNAIAEQRRAGTSYGLGSAVAAMAWGLVEKGEYDRALECAREAVGYALREGAMSWVLHTLSVLHARRGDAERAAQLAGYVVAEIARLGWVERPTVLRQQQEVMERISADLGAEEAARQTARGAQFTEDEAVAICLGR